MTIKNKTYNRLFFYFLCLFPLFLNAQALVKDIHSFSRSSSIQNITQFQGKAYFSAWDDSSIGLFVSDGQPKGTKLVKKVAAINNKMEFATSSSLLFFTTDDYTTKSLWKSDGTEGGTLLVKTLSTNTDAEFRDIYVLNNTVYISLFIREVGHELWKSDGTEGGTVKIRDFYQPNSTSINWRELSFVAHINSTLFFMANDGTNGLELWKTTGTAATTTMVKNINTDPTTNDGDGLSLTIKEDRSYAVVGNKLYFAASDTSDLDDGIWSTDGTETGTTKLYGLENDVPNNFVKIGTSIYFLHFLSDLYRINTAVDTVGSIGNTGSGGWEKVTLFAHQNTLHFTISQWTLSSDFSGLYRWDAQRDTAVFLRPFYSFVTTPLSIGDKLYFMARDSNLTDVTNYFWVSNGTAAGTKIAFDFPFKVQVNKIASLNNTLLMVAHDAFHGEELWKYNALETGLLPKPKFTSLQDKFTMAFINQSDNTKNFKWWSSSASFFNDTVKNPVIELTPQKHKIVLEGINDYGSSFFVDSINLKAGTFDIYPKISGNKGYVTCEIKGVGLNRNSKFYLLKNGERDIQPDSLIYQSEDRIIALFAMNNAPIGKRAIVSVTNQDTFYLKDSFDIQLVKSGFELDLNINGPDFIRNGVVGQFQATITNTNNVDAFAIPLIIRGIPYSDTSKYEVKILAGIDSITGDRRQDSIYFANKQSLDSIFQKGIRLSTDSTEIIINVLISKIPSNTSIIFPFTLKRISGFNTNSLILDATVLSPMIENDSTFFRQEGSFAKCYQPLFKCGLAIASAAKFIPGSTCIQEGIKLNTKTGLGAYGSLTDNTPIKYGDLAKDIFTATAKCALDLMPFKTGVALAQTAVDLFSKTNNLVDCAGAGISIAHHILGECKKKKKQESGGGGSNDPNSKTGVGVTSTHAVAKGQSLSYYIHFENMATAALPAEEVVILDTLDKNKLDLNSLQFTGFSFGDSIWGLNNKSTFFELIDMRPRKDFLVSVTGSLDKETGILRCNFSTLNPFTLTPLNTLDGFLPPNQIAPKGEGWISYQIQQKNNLVNNDTIKNRAAIYFDYNPPILTDTWVNRIDNEKPISRINTTLRRLNDTTINMTLTGSDNLSGVDYYEIYVSVNDSSYTLWNIVTQPTATYIGKLNKRYKFYSVAVDGVGLIEDAPTNPLVNPDASITLSPTATKDLNDITYFKVYPNPSNSTVNIQFEIDKPCQADMLIYNALGQLIFSKKLNYTEGGVYEEVWQPLNHQEGLFKVCLKWNNHFIARTVAVLP